jgi:hypothetical protein
MARLILRGVFAIAATSPVARAALDDTIVHGTLLFTQISPTTNFYDPASGFVPPGFGNSSSPSVVISSVTEFGFDSGVAGARIHSDFTDSTLTITNTVFSSGLLSPYRFIFTDTAFAGISEISDTFDHGGLTASIEEQTITLNYAGGGVNAGTMVAVYAIAVPEPTWATVLCAAASLSALRRRQRWQWRSKVLETGVSTLPNRDPSLR